MLILVLFFTIGALCFLDVATSQKFTIRTSCVSDVLQLLNCLFNMAAKLVAHCGQNPVGKIGLTA